MVWGPDAKLTDLGIEQAQEVHKRWKTELHRGGGVPLPTSFYSSPLSRAARTLEISFEGMRTTRPLIMESLREIIGLHTCDKRLTATEIHDMFPGFDIEDGFSEKDVLWRPDTRETHAEMDRRIRSALDCILSKNDTCETYFGKTFRRRVR